MPEPLPFPSQGAGVTDESPLRFAKVWWYLLQALWQRSGGATIGSDPVAVAVGASPYSYAATARGMVVVSGGTVTAIDIVRGGVTVALGVIAGAIPVSTGDVVVVTYAVAPTMTFVQGGM